MLQAVYENIVETLHECDVAFEEIEHAQVHTTDESKTERAKQGWTEGTGSKNIVFHAKGRFYAVTTIAEKNIKARLFKGEFGTKDIRFAYPEEVAENTGCMPGAIPPFGHTHPDLPIYADKEILKFSHFMFNPAVHTKSLRIKSEDLLKVFEVIPNPVKLFEITEEGIFFEELKKRAY